MGKLVERSNTRALVDGITDVISDPGRYMVPVTAIEQHYLLSKTIDSYERLFRDIVSSR
jgi:hypothetical protein